MNSLKDLLCLILVMGLAATQASAAEVVLQETFQDGDRSNLRPKESASWFTSQHLNSIKIVEGKLRWLPKNQHQTVVAYFQNLEPKRVLKVGETLTASFDITFPGRVAYAVNGLRVGLLVSGSIRVEADEFGAEFPDGHGGVFAAVDVGPDAGKGWVAVRPNQTGNAMVGPLGPTGNYKIIKAVIPSSAIVSSKIYTVKLSMKRKLPDAVVFSCDIRDGDGQVFSCSTDVLISDFLPNGDQELVADTLALGRVGGEEGFDEALISNVNAEISSTP